MGLNLLGWVPVEGKQFHSYKLFPVIFLSLWQKFMEVVQVLHKFVELLFMLHNIWGKDPKEEKSHGVGEDLVSS